MEEIANKGATIPISTTPNYSPAICSLLSIKGDNSIMTAIPSKSKESHSKPQLPSASQPGLEVSAESAQTAKYPTPSPIFPLRP